MSDIEAGKSALPADKIRSFRARCRRERANWWLLRVRMTKVVAGLAPMSDSDRFGSSLIKREQVLKADQTARIREVVPKRQRPKLMTPEDVGQRIRAARDAGVTQRSVAASLDRSASFLCLIEMGEWTLPGELIRAVSDAVGVPPTRVTNWLLQMRLSRAVSDIKTLSKTVRLGIDVVNVEDQLSTDQIASVRETAVT